MEVNYSSMKVKKNFRGGKFYFHGGSKTNFRGSNFYSR